MTVEIEPSELNFRRPFTVEVPRTLTIKNPNTTPVAFKVKTTAPKQYCVRPNSGRIEPGQDVEVTVLLQAMKAEPPLETKCRDKFLVQSAPITGDKEFASIQSVLETTDKSKIQEKKIRVNWLAADLNGASHEGPTATPVKSSLASGGDVEGTPDVSRAYGSPTNDDAASTAPPPYTTESEMKEEEPEKEAAGLTTTKPTEPVKQAVPMTYEELKAALERAEAELKALRQEAHLRQRKTGGDQEKSVQRQAPQLDQAQRQGAEGVPVNIVAILCLISFLIAFFFF